MSIHKLLKNITVCGVSLMMMIASLSAGAVDVSARRARHYRPRTHRMIMSNHALYKLGEKETNDFTKYAINWKTEKLASKLQNTVIKNLIKFNFNKSYIKGLQLQNDAETAGSSAQLQLGVLSDAKRLVRKHSHKSTFVKHHAVKRHARKYVKRNKHARKTRKATAKHHHVRKYVAKPTASKTNVNTSESSNNNTTSTNSSTDNSSNTDLTDGGKYYSWNQLEDILNDDNTDGDALYNGYASDTLKNKIKDTIWNEVDNYSYKQLDDLSQNTELYQLDPNLYNIVGNEKSIKWEATQLK